MRLRPVCGPWRAAAVASCLALSVGGVADCTADRGASNPSSVSRPTIGPGETVVRVLQMNLCNSGLADCYSGGRAVTMAAALIHRDRPDMVSLNEVCREDVEVLKRTMSATFQGADVASAFKSADDRRTQSPYRCENGQQFGDGVVAVVPSAAYGSRIHSGVYPVQDLNDPEERVWVCIDLAPQFAGCTTHTASTSTTVALAQCRYLLNSAVPTMRHGDDVPIILGADLNLAAGGSPGPQSCLPRGYGRTDDGALQVVVVSPGDAVRSHSTIDMRGTTDHPGLLAEVVLSRH